MDSHEGRIVRLEEASSNVRETLGAIKSEVEANRTDTQETRADVKGLRNVLVGFAFSIAGGSVLLALTIFVAVKG